MVSMSRSVMHPAVAEVCVEGILDPRQGEAVKAWVVRKDGFQTTQEELQQFCGEKLTGYRVPRFFEFRKDLPKTMVGKVLRRTLQDEEKEKQEEMKRGEGSEHPHPCPSEEKMGVGGDSLVY